jgi:predicted CoA-binding protein
MNDSDKYANPSEDQIKVILRKCKKVAVVGLSSDDTRPSNAVARLLQKKGFTIFPVNPKEKKILGRKAYPDLKSIPQPVEIVDIFRKPEHVPAIVDEAIRVGAKVVWMQDGVVNHPAALKAVANGIIVVMDRCMARDCRRFCD